MPTTSTTALRAAHRLGGVEPPIAQGARRRERQGPQRQGAARRRAGRAPATTRDMSSAAIQWLRRSDKIAEAGQLMLAAPRDPPRSTIVDEWWIERRLLARKLLDIGDRRTAYQVAREAAPPTKENYRVEHEFTAGWIALRFLKDPATPPRSISPASAPASPTRSRWRAPAIGGAAPPKRSNKPQEARAHYEAAARHSTAYYGQLARARLGLGEIALAPPPAPSADKRAALAHTEVVRAAEMLYAVDERDLVASDRGRPRRAGADVDELAALAELAARHDDARCMPC